MFLVYRNVSVVTTQLREISLGQQVYVSEEWREFIDFSSCLVLCFADSSASLMFCRKEHRVIL